MSNWLLLHTYWKWLIPKKILSTCIIIHVYRTVQRLSNYNRFHICIVHICFGNGLAVEVCQAWVRIPLETYIFILMFSLPFRPISSAEPMQMKLSMTIHQKLLLFLTPDTINHARPTRIYCRCIALNYETHFTNEFDIILDLYRNIGNGIIKFIFKVIVILQ